MYYFLTTSSCTEQLLGFFNFLLLYHLPNLFKILNNWIKGKANNFPGNGNSIIKNQGADAVPMFPFGAEALGARCWECWLLTAHSWVSLWELSVALLLTLSPPWRQLVPSIGRCSPFVLFLFLFLFIYLLIQLRICLLIDFRERGRKRQRERKRNINMREKHRSIATHIPWLGIKTTTKVCALTGNWTHILLEYRTTL